MLRINIGTDGKDIVMASGTLADISAEICVVINDLYQKMKQDAPAAAKAFKAGIVHAVTDPENPVWSEELRAGFAMMAVLPKEDKQ